jgi:TolB protein
MKKHLFKQLAMLAVAIPGVHALRAAEAPTITISKTDTVAIAIGTLAGPDGAQAAKVLQNDLALSGYFNLTSPANAAFVVNGSASGTGLDGRVADHGGQTALARSYSGGTRAGAHRFADDIIETLTGNKGFASTRIAFVATRTGRKEIYVADYDGSNARQLTSDHNISVNPSLSPDGRRLAYTGYKSGYADIYLVDLGSGSRERIVKYPGTNSGASFSPDGGRIACTLSKDGNPELYVTGASGGGARRLTHTPGVESSPSWSPDGNEIVYSSDDRGGPQLFRISSGGGSGSLIATGFSYCTEPNWSPDGKKIAFSIRQGGFQIAVHDLQSGQTRVLCSGQRPAWGADSRHLLYADGGALFLIDAQTGRKTNVLDGLGKITEPTWSR